MALQVIRGGAPVDIPTPGEVADAVDARARAFAREQRQIETEREMERARAVKWMRLPVLSGTASASAITLSDLNGAPLGPDQGFAWNLRRIVIDGMTSGATPDVLNMYRNAITGQPPLWQFNGNNFGYTFGNLAVVLLSGDFLKFASVGTFAATGTIRVTGEVVEVPAEMLPKLAL
jgi:hypothetical protein